ncbi:MAG: hypothetical protein IID44_07705 [Planctomycetes bacterium]|nr:hypothetical protein [Planctomycetota bacterium]
MRPARWQKNHQSARVVLPRFVATINVARPDLGLCELQLDGAALDSCGVLQVGGPSLSADPAVPVADWYVRGADLVVSYAPSDPDQLSPQVYWRVLDSPHEGVIAAFELVVSVQTDLLASHPALAAAAQFPQCETARLVDAEAGRYQPLAVTGDAPLTLTAADGPGVILFRLPGDRYSFAHFIHPVDFQQATLDLNHDAPGLVRLSHSLFGEDLEKGVIRRARCQGIFLDRADDAALAAECYGRFAATAPPLTT